MARKSVPALRDQHPGRHLYCDCCGEGLSYEGGYTRGRRETAAGSFEYALCHGCSDKIESKRKPQRDREYQHAMVRHAARYSPNFGSFVAEWFGIARSDTAKLPPRVLAR